MIRPRRRELGLSQTMLGDESGVSFKQIQKYESGTNRIDAGRFYEISLALDADVERFFDGAPGSESTHQLPDEIAAIAMDRECGNLVTAYYEIPDPQLRQTFLSLLRTISEDE
ncbi:MAG: helix-turn-helix transcriptional regulator [Pseudomonadota bacterium]|nr:helix-turn-helix transcriptional regulator [Pseudomonadota bacterium]